MENLNWNLLILITEQFWDRTCFSLIVKSQWCLHFWVLLCPFSNKVVPYCHKLVVVAPRFIPPSMKSQNWISELMSLVFHIPTWTILWIPFLCPLNKVWAYHSPKNIKSKSGIFHKCSEEILGGENHTQFLLSSLPPPFKNHQYLNRCKKLFDKLNIVDKNKPWNKKMYKECTPK